MMEAIKEDVSNLTNKYENTNLILNSEDAKIVENFCCAMRVPILDKSDDNPYNEDDFTHSKVDTANNLTQLRNFYCAVKYSNSNEGDAFSNHKNLVCNMIVTCSEFCDETCEWSNKKCALLAEHLLRLILNDPNHTCPLEEDEKETNNCKCSIQYCFDRVLKQLLQYLSSNFEKSSFKNSPGTRQYYLWLLYNISASHLAEHLSYLLPGALFMLDDWEPRHKFAALDALSYILNSVAASELRLHGRASVIFDASRRHVYSRDADQLSKAYPVAIKAGEILQGDSKTSGLLEFSKLDDIVCSLLTEMVYEQRTDLRKVYCEILPRAVGAAGLRNLLYSEDFNKVVESYASSAIGSDAEDVLKVLEAVEVVIAYCWSMYHTLALPILTTLVKLVCECCDSSTTTLKESSRSELLERCRSIVQLSYQVAPGTCETLCRGMEDLQIDGKLKKDIQFVFQFI